MEEQGTAAAGGGSSGERKGPSMVPGMVLLAVAAALIVLVLVNPDMPDWLRRTVAGVAIAVVVALLGYSVWLMRTTMRRGGK